MECNRAMRKLPLIFVFLSGIAIHSPALFAQDKAAELQSLQARLQQLQTQDALEAAPQALGEMRDALEAMHRMSQGSPDYSLQKRRFEDKAREVEIDVQARRDTEQVRVLEQEQQALVADLQRLQMRRADLEDRIARRDQDQARRQELSTELEQQRRARQAAEARLAQLATEHQQVEAGLNTLLAQVAQVQDTADGKHLLLDNAALFSHGAQLSGPGTRRLQYIVNLVKILPDRSFSVRVAPDRAGGNAAGAQLRAQALADALVQAGLPAANVGIADNQGLAAGTAEIVISKATAPSETPP